MRPRKTTEEHELAGTVPQYSAGESHIKASRPKPPTFLSEEAKVKFKQLARQLALRRSITAGDGDLLTLYCSLWERWVRALVHLRDEGDICKYNRLDSSGCAVEVERENLHVKVAQNSERQMVTILKQLGLTPKDKDSVRPTAPRKSLKPPPPIEGTILSRAETTLPVPEIDLSTIEEGTDGQQ
jgi:P27 family predicted phage terminase small subunit